jgi:predicted nucleic acid-binding protein
MILLDSDILIDFFRGHPASMAWFQLVDMTEIAIPGIVAMELYAGCHSKQEQARVRRKLDPFTVVWPSSNALNAIVPMFVSAHLTHSLGILDALIAATSITHNSPLHTFNRKHFAAVPGLQTIQPYTR